MVHCPHGHDSQCWAKPNPRAWKFIGISPPEMEGPGHFSQVLLLPRLLAESCMGRETAGTQTHAYKGYGHLNEQLNSVSHQPPSLIPSLPVIYASHFYSILLGITIWNWSLFWFKIAWEKTCELNFIVIMKIIVAICILQFFFLACQSNHH